jgi:hypothetical protein
MPALIALLVSISADASPASAHGTEVHFSHSIWTFDPWIVVPLPLPVRFMRWVWGGTGGAPAAAEQSCFGVPPRTAQAG